MGGYGCTFEPEVCSGCSMYDCCELEYELEYGPKDKIEVEPLEVPGHETSKSSHTDPNSTDNSLR